MTSTSPVDSTTSSDSPAPSPVEAPAPAAQAEAGRITAPTTSPSSDSATAADAATTTPSAPAPASVNPAAREPRAPRDGRPPRTPGRNDAARPQRNNANSDKRRPAQAPGRAQPPVHPALLRLRELYPQVFGNPPLPLKLGSFHDIVAAHPDVFDAKALREALGQHTRSSRYLEQVAVGTKRADLQGQPVEDMAPEHVHQAIMEMSRRDRSGSREAAQAKVRLRLKNAFEASGLSRSEYAERVKPPIEEWNALLDHAYAEHGASGAKREALRRAYEASGLTPEKFASDYGMALETVQAALA